MHPIKSKNLHQYKLSNNSSLYVKHRQLSVFE